MGDSPPGGPRMATLATLSDAAAVHAIREACAQLLTSKHGDGHWGYVPSQSRIAQGIKDGQVYVVKIDAEIDATLTLSNEAPSFFDLSLFQDARAVAVYLTGLAVRPDRQGQGLGRRCMAEVERLAKDARAAAIRFDAYDAPAGAAGFYLKCGYRLSGRKSFRNVPLAFFEKSLAKG